MIRARPRLCRFLAVGLLVLVAGLGAAPPPSKSHRAQPEDLSHWQWYDEVKPPPDAGGSGLVDLIVPPHVFGRANLDLGDLRLADDDGKIVPYALRIRTPRNEQAPLPQREFDRVTNPDHSVEVRIDLGEAPPEHNEIAVHLAGTGYGRPLRLDGSADNKTWSKVLDDVYVVHLQIAGKEIDQHRFRYPPSRFRYLRVQVGPDRVIENDRPKLESVQVYHTVNVPGENVTWPARLGPREPGRMDGEYSSAWVIDLGEGNVPCEQLTLEIDEQDYARPFQLEQMFDQNASPQVIVSGQLQRPPGQRSSSVQINLQRPVQTRKLRLTVQDARNPPLTIKAVTFTAAARQVVFAMGPGVKVPLRLYYGNPRAGDPHYDFAAHLPLRLDPPPARAELSGPTPNPTYVPPPKPWTERWPYLVDVVLGVACVVLLGILFVLARTAIGRHDATHPSATPA